MPPERSSAIGKQQISLMDGIPKPAKFSMSRWLNKQHPRLGRLLMLLQRTGLPFMPWPDHTPLRRLRHFCRRLQFSDRVAWQRWSIWILATLYWPVAVPNLVLERLSGLPAADRPATAFDWVRRACHMMLLALRDNIPPTEYVLYRLHRPDQRHRLDSTLFASEPQWLSVWLAQKTGARLLDIQDKSRFADLCRLHGLPCIPTLAAYRDGIRLFPEHPFIPDHPHLWVKDLTGNSGAGAACWRRHNGIYHEERLGLSAAPEALEKLWQRRACLVQPWLVAHSSLLNLSTGSAIADFRILSAITPTGTVAIIAAQAWLGITGQAATQHITAVVDDDGRLGTPLFAGYRPLTHHPDTGADLTNVLVPHWRDALDLVKRAHRQVPEFAHFPFLGWDVAITHDGPVLIETNVGWDSTYLQATTVPLGQTALPSIVMAYAGGR